MEAAGLQYLYAPPARPQVGLAEQCEVVRGNFLEMPFEANTFDGAYAIEATCHAAKVRAAPDLRAYAQLLSCVSQAGVVSLSCAAYSLVKAEARGGHGRSM